MQITIATESDILNWNHVRRLKLDDGTLVAVEAGTGAEIPLGNNIVAWSARELFKLCLQAIASTPPSANAVIYLIATPVWICDGVVRFYSSLGKWVDAVDNR